MISSKRPIVVYIEQARIPDETTSITRSEVPITGDIVVHHRIQNGANNKAMGDGFLKELYDVLNGAVGENLRFEDGASVFVYTSCARSIENYENFERNIRFGSDLPVHSFRACQKIFNLCKENHYDLHMSENTMLGETIKSDARAELLNVLRKTGERRKMNDGTGNNLVVDSDAELKAFLSSILSSEGIVVNINRTFIAYNNGTNRNRVFARCANRMAQKGTDEKFVVIALMCYPALNWILKARDIDAMIEQLHDMDTDGSVRNISEIQSLLENSTGYVKPRLHLEMRKLFFARCQQLVDAVDDAMNRAVFRSAQPCKPARISLAMAMLRGSILDSDPVSAVMIRNNFDGIIEDIAKVSGEAIKELVLQLAPNEGVVQGAEAAYLYHNTEVLLREYSRITHPSSVDGNSTLRLIATAGNQLDASDHKSDARYAQAQILLQYAKLIGGAIELLKQFPDGDSKLYDVLMLVVNEKYGPNGTDEATLAKQVGINSSYFCEKKHRAYTALSALLWGCDIESLLSLLSKD